MPKKTTTSRRNITEPDAIWKMLEKNDKYGVGLSAMIADMTIKLYGEKK